ncbi:hypothetical protein [Halosegnis marinus]|uniref:hypothetical protein n=1 Tax=Halosegnis marinus TaxID=3034023 RepID=UPI00361D3B5E
MSGLDVLAEQFRFKIGDGRNILEKFLMGRNVGVNPIPRDSPLAVPVVLEPIMIDTPSQPLFVGVRSVVANPLGRDPFGGDIRDITDRKTGEQRSEVPVGDVSVRPGAGPSGESIIRAGT